MSLQIWLPLNGDLRQQGLVDWNPTLQSGTTASYVDGKIGKALNTGGIVMPASVAKQVMNNNAYSYVCWIYVNGAESSTSERAMIFGNNTMNTLGGRQFSLFQYPNANSLHWSWQKYDGSSYTMVHTSTLSNVLPSYQWTHIAVTYQNPTGKIYINGELMTTFTGIADSISYEYDTQCIHNSAYHYLNDVRIYDHCLSVKEVKELAKGLSLHYKLSGYGENLILNNSDASYGSLTGWSLAGNGWVNSLVDNDDALGGKVVRCTFTNTTMASGGIHHPTGNTKGDLTDGAIYTLSARIRASKACIASFHNELMTTQNIINLTTEWKVYSYTCAIDNSRTYHSNVIYVRVADVEQNMWIECDWIKLELGSKATPWCPSVNDSRYSALGFDNGIEYDCSGFGNNAIKTNNVTISSDTPRHLGSYYFDGNKSWYQMDRPLYDYYNNDFSISVWLKPTDSTRSVIISEYGGSGASNVAFELKATRQLRLYWNGSPDIGTTQSLTLNEWSHCVITKKDNTFKFYINGEMIQSYTNSSDLSSRVSNGYPRIGDDYRGNSANTVSYMGYMSDFRMYTTCLSDDDVLELYNVSASVDNNGGLYAYEVVEQ